MKKTTTYMLLVSLTAFLSFSCGKTNTVPDSTSPKTDTSTPVIKTYKITYKLTKFGKFSDYDFGIVYDVNGPDGKTTQVTYFPTASDTENCSCATTIYNSGPITIELTAKTNQWVLIQARDQWFNSRVEIFQDGALVATGDSHLGANPTNQYASAWYHVK